MPVTGHGPSRVMLAWRAGEPDKLVLDLVGIAEEGAGTRAGQGKGQRREQDPSRGAEIGIPGRRVEDGSRAGGVGQSPRPGWGPWTTAQLTTRTKAKTAA